MTVRQSEDTGRSWLHEYLVRAVESGVCVQIHCTTCGAGDFRRGLLDGVAAATARPRIARWDGEAAHALVVALGRVRPSVEDEYRIEPAARFVLVDAWQALGGPASEPVLEALLAGTWAGDVLARMQAHHRERVAARLRYEETQDPIRVQERRDEKRRLKQEQREERLARKYGRDRISNERQGETRT